MSTSPMRSARSLAACEGSLLVVDASQGVEAQTLANVYQAIDAGHEIVPVLNKVDLPAAEPERIRQQIEDVIGLDASDAMPISAKTGLNIERVLEAIVTSPAAAQGRRRRAAQGAARRFLVRRLSRRRRAGAHRRRRAEEGPEDPHDRRPTRITRSTGSASSRPRCSDVEELGPGRDRLHHRADQGGGRHPRRRHHHRREQARAAALPGFKPAQPVVFCGLFPVDAADFEDLREAMGKLRLNDASFSYEMETSAALGFGFRCGFLGLLHLEIIRERLEREFNLDLIATAPSVIYQIVHDPRREIDAAQSRRHARPGADRRRSRSRGSRATILVPDEYLGAVLKLCEDRRGVQIELTYAGGRAMVVYDLPLNEVVFDFYDRLKSVSSGYASFDYHIEGYHEGDLVKMSILVNAEPVDALSMIVHRDARRGARPRHVREAEGADPARICSRSRSRRRSAARSSPARRSGACART